MVYYDTGFCGSPPFRPVRIASVFLGATSNVRRRGDGIVIDMISLFAQARARAIGENKQSLCVL